MLRFHWGLAVILICLSSTPASPVELEGQVSGWGALRDGGSSSGAGSIGVRYIPALYGGWGVDRETAIDFEISANLLAYGRGNEPLENATVDLYRLWVRYATPWFESRIGLQKINFGPARILRSLMWFDRLDPQDPLQLAEGVTGLRLWTVFQNNANLWLWALYGNTGTKGIEFSPSEENSPEYGGRFQVPVGNGEMAVTTHYRLADENGKPVAERRIALDGAWDVGVGALFECALIRSDTDNPVGRWQSFLTLGTDYTFDVGNGLTVLYEHLLFTYSDYPFGPGGIVRILSGLMTVYPLTLVDQISYFSFYGWNEGLPYHYLSWQRNYDAWIFHISIFWSAGEVTGLKESQTVTQFGARGLQLMLIFNH